MCSHAVGSDLTTLVAVGNSHLLGTSSLIWAADQLGLFSMARFIHIEARPVLLREPWIAFPAPCVLRLSADSTTDVFGGSAFGWSWFLRHALHDGDSLGRDVVATVRVYALVARPFFRSLLDVVLGPGDVFEAVAKSVAWTILLGTLHDLERLRDV